MTPTLSPQQREEVLEAMFRVNHHPLAEASSVELQKLGKALDAALPAIIGAVLERAAQCAEQHTFRAEYTPNAIASDIRALAEEMR